MTRDMHTARQTADYILQHLDKPLDIPSLTAISGRSKYSLERIFKKTFNQTVHQFILTKRLEAAYRLLTTTDLPIKQLAAMTGFRSITTFTMQFRKKYDVTPGALRDKQ